MGYHVKVFLVIEFGKYLIFQFSLLAKSPALVWYRATCSTVDSLVSPTNLVNFGTFQPLENSGFLTYVDNGVYSLVWGGLS